MPIRNDFKPGEFCWVDFGAHDLEAAAAFYGGLFGWKAVSQAPPGAPAYSFFMKGEAPAGGGAQLNEEMKAMGPPGWNSYVCVEDCVASEKKAAALGANIKVPTQEIPGHGKLCFFTDPEGATVAMWQNLGAANGVFVSEPGGFAWNELMCRDVAKAREFYSQLFGWEFVDMPMGDVNYTMIKVHGADGGGMMEMNEPKFEGVPNHWMVYFAVADCDATAKKVKETGGQVRIPPTEIPVGKFSLLVDPQGGAFSIVQLTQQ